MLSCSLNSMSEHGSQDLIAIAAIGFDSIGVSDQPPHPLKSGLPQRHRPPSRNFLSDRERPHTVMGSLFVYPKEISDPRALTHGELLHR